MLYSDPSVGWGKITKSKSHNYQLNYLILSYVFLHVEIDAIGMTSYDVMRLNEGLRLKKSCFTFDMTFVRHNIPGP